MKPVDLEHEILLTLHSTPGQAIHAIRRRITTSQGEGPGWRQVANAVMRIERRGWVHVVREEEVNGTWHPGYELTLEGRAMADQVRTQRINAHGMEVSA